MPDRANRWEKRSGSLHYRSDGGPGVIAVPLDLKSNHYLIEMEFTSEFLNMEKDRVHIKMPSAAEETHFAIRFHADGIVRIGPRPPDELEWSPEPSDSGKAGIHWDARDPIQTRIEILLDGKVTDSWEGDPLPHKKERF